MFTMWAALPGPLILSADLRASAMNTGAGLDADVLRILTNKAVIAVNQDGKAAPMRPVRRQNGLEVWKKPLTVGMAVVFFHRSSSSAASRFATAERDHPSPARNVSVTWPELGLAAGAKQTVRDLWAGRSLGVRAGGFFAAVDWHEASIYTLVPVDAKAGAETTTETEETRVATPSDSEAPSAGPFGWPFSWSRIPTAMFGCNTSGPESRGQMAFNARFGITICERDPSVSASEA